MVMVTRGLSETRLQDVEKFDAHAALVETLLLIKDMVSNPKLLSDLAQRKADALKLTADEEKKRQEALDLISRTDQLKSSFVALDERERAIDAKHQDNILQISKMQEDARKSIENREKLMKESEQQLRNKKEADAKAFAELETKHKKLSEEIKNRQRLLDEKEQTLIEKERKIEEVKAALRN